jgi:hypothetical protein
VRPNGGVGGIVTLEDWGLTRTGTYWYKLGMDTPTVAQAMRHFEKQKHWLFAAALRYEAERNPDSELELQERARDYSTALDLLNLAKARSAES